MFRYIDDVLFSNVMCIVCHSNNTFCNIFNTLITNTALKNTIELCFVQIIIFYHNVTTCIQRILKSLKTKG